MPHASVPTGAIENNRFLYFSPTLLPKNLDSLDDTLGKSVLIHSIINIWIGGFVTHENWTCLWLVKI
jgi:aminopeptidase N